MRSYYTHRLVSHAKVQKKSQNQTFRHQNPQKWQFKVPLRRIWGELVGLVLIVAEGDPSPSLSPGTVVVHYIPPG